MPGRIYRFTFDKSVPLLDALLDIAYPVLGHYAVGWPWESRLLVEGWLIGLDSLLELHTWRRVADLSRSCTIVTAARPGFEPDFARLKPLLSADALEVVAAHVVPTPRIEISASQIRARRRAGCSIRFLTPEPVIEYIERNGLYAG